MLAMDRPMLVLPTPGGPTKHSIGPNIKISNSTDITNE